MVNPVPLFRLFLRKKMLEDAADYLLDIIILKDNAASSAILDRLLHHGYLLKFEGKSCRLKEAAKRLSESKG